jgi:hypothetical protein
MYNASFEHPIQHPRKTKSKWFLSLSLDEIEHLLPDSKDIFLRRELIQNNRVGAKDRYANMSNMW